MSDSDSDESLEVFYCGVCGLPPEFTPWLPKETLARCKPWLLENCDFITKVFPEWEDEAGGEEGEGGVGAGGSGAADAAGAAEAMDGLTVKDGEGQAAAEEAPKKKSSKKKKKKDKELVITKAVRNKRKCITTVTGLHHWKVKLNEAAKLFGKKFACGASVTKNASQIEEIDVQGDCLYEIAQLILQKYPDVPKDAFYFVEDKKKRHALDEL